MKTVISVDAVRGAIAGYQLQFDTLQQQIAALDADYQQKRETAVTIQLELRGAIAALEGLIPAAEPAEDTTLVEAAKDVLSEA